MTADELIAALRLRPHPEGGFFRETYRAAGGVPAAALPAAFDGPRSLATAILFLLRGGEFSAFHRLRCDELWHFHLGSALELIEIAPDGRLVTTRLGPDVAAGERLQAAVPAGRWFAARPAEPEPASFSLLGCTTAPGFEFTDLELADRDALAAAFPQHAASIRRLTRE